MQSKLEVLTMRVNEVEERVSDIEDKLMVKRETEGGARWRKSRVSKSPVSTKLPRKPSNYPENL